MTGEFTTRALVFHLREMGEPWPVYYDPSNDKYTTLPGKNLVHLGWYGPDVSEWHIVGDTRFVMQDLRAMSIVG